MYYRLDYWKNNGLRDSNSRLNPAPAEGLLSLSAAGLPIVQGVAGVGVNASVGLGRFYKKSRLAGVVNLPHRRDTLPFLRSDGYWYCRLTFAVRLWDFGLLDHWTDTRDQPVIRGARSLNIDCRPSKIDRRAVSRYN